DHQAFGAGLCESWKFPKSFGYVTGHHHNPLELPESSRLLSLVVHVADHLAGQTGLGFRADLQSLDVTEEVLSELRLTKANLDEIRNLLPQVYEDVEATFR